MARLRFASTAVADKKASSDASRTSDEKRRLMMRMAFVGGLPLEHDATTFEAAL
jgi:hypothetical protein